MSVVVYRCLKHCGWTRAFQLNHDWMYQTLAHPVWGIVTSKELVRLEILNHDCMRHFVARTKIQKLQQHWNEAFQPSGRGPLARTTSATAPDSYLEPEE